MTINERIFLLLEKCGKTQKSLADSIGVNEGNIGTWKMRGSDPPAKLIYQIAVFFGVSVEWLLTGEEHNQSSFVNNGAVSGNLGPNSDLIYVINSNEHVLSEECSELVQVYKALNIRDRIKLLDCAFKIADNSTSKQKSTEEDGM